MKINDFMRAVHATAVEHGWWDSEVPSGEKFAMIHSEWSEAIDEYRRGNPAVYTGENGKPEGYAVELADGIIRVLDALAHAGYVFADDKDIASMDAPDAVGGLKLLSFPSKINLLHNMTTDACRGDFVTASVAIICTVITMLKVEGIDVEGLLLMKHHYNESRPYRHGNKLC